MSSYKPKQTKPSAAALTSPAAAQIAALGGEPLAESGFETETPEPGFIPAGASLLDLPDLPAPRE